MYEMNNLKGAQPITNLGVPFTPLVTIGLCFWLMYRLGGITWVRFGIWLLAGLLIYFVYSARHSKLQKTA